MNLGEYKITIGRDDETNVRVGNINYPFCCSTAAINAVATNDKLSFTSKFRGFEEVTNN